MQLLEMGTTETGHRGQRGVVGVARRRRGRRWWLMVTRSWPWHVDAMATLVVQPHGEDRTT